VGETKVQASPSLRSLQAAIDSGGGPRRSGRQASGAVGSGWAQVPFSAPRGEVNEQVWPALKPAQAAIDSGGGALRSAPPGALAGCG
jgi:hypothetical protein